MRQYRSLIKEFPALHDSFSPHTRGKIGFAGELWFPTRIGMHGFRPIGDSDEEVLLVPVDASDKHSVRLLVAGVAAAHSWSLLNGFRSAVSLDLVREIEIADQLEKIVKTGRLNEAAAPELAEELIACVLASHKFFADFVDQKTRQVRYPVDLAAVMTALKREFLKHHFRDEVVEAKRRSGEVKEEWRGTTVSYSANLSPGEEQHVATRVDVSSASFSVRI